MFDDPANCSALKNRMLNIDGAFDEKALGFKTFYDAWERPAYPAFPSVWRDTWRTRISTMHAF